MPDTDTLAVLEYPAFRDGYVISCLHSFTIAYVSREIQMRQSK